MYNINGIYPSSSPCLKAGDSARGNFVESDLLLEYVEEELINVIVEQVNFIEKIYFDEKTCYINVEFNKKQYTLTANFKQDEDNKCKEIFHFEKIDKNDDDQNFRDLFEFFDGEDWHCFYEKLEEKLYKIQSTIESK